MAIPASKIVSINPRVITAGGTDLEMNGLLLSKNSNIPLASIVMEFTSANAVGEYLGTDTPEYIAASKYFAGYENCYAYPKRMMIARRVDKAVGGEIKGAKYNGKLGDLLEIYNGALELMYNGTAYKFTGIDLSGAESYSDVAGIIEANIAEQLTNISVNYSSLNGGFSLDASYVADTDNTLEAVEYEADENENPEPDPEPEPEPEPEPDPEPETKYGTLTVSKQVDGESDASAFGFKVEIGDESYDITLDNDEYKSYDGVPEGTSFTVTETDAKGANSVSYTVDEEEPVEGTTVSGVIEGDADTDVTFINAYVEDENPDDGGNPDGGDPDNDNPDDGDNGGDTNPDDDGNGNDGDEGEPVAHKAHPVPLAADDDYTDLAVVLGLLADDGAINSTGSDAMSIDDNFKAIRKLTDNWVCFTTAYPAEDDEMIEYSQWASSQGVQYLYVIWTLASNMLVQGETVSIASQLKEINAGSTALFYGDLDYAAFIMSEAASIDWNRNQGVITFAFKRQDGLAATVVDETEADILLAKNCNIYGKYATRNDEYDWLYNGTMFGDYTYIDPYINAIWLNNALQVALMEGLKMSPRTPYTDAGYTMIRAWMMDPIERAIRNGTIDEGVELSNAQKAEIYQETGQDISDDLYANGWYIFIEDAGAEVRANRESPNISLYYCYGGSVHKLTVASTALL